MNDALGGILTWKERGEDALRASGASTKLHDCLVCLHFV
jgi:hypothetical protein